MHLFWNDALCLISFSASYILRYFIFRSPQEYFQGLTSVNSSLLAWGSFPPMSKNTIKKVSDFPAPSRGVT
jgi:hypothetical protein